MVTERNLNSGVSCLLAHFSSEGIVRCEQSTFLYIKGTTCKRGVIIQLLLQ